jgi:hypothetical protein
MLEARVSKSAVDGVLHAGFAKANPEFSPVPIWWWSGEALEIDRMIWQIDQLVAQGVYNAVILNLAPTGPMHGALSDAPHMLTDDWWGIWDAICVHAQKVGMRFWFYDQIGFSGANYQAQLVAAYPQFAAEQLRSIAVEGSGELRVECPGGATPVAAYVVSATGEVLYVPTEDRAARASAATPSRLRLVYSIRQGYDYSQSAACEKLLDTVHREFARRLPQHIGTTIVGHDETEPLADVKPLDGACDFNDV